MEAEVIFEINKALDYLKENISVVEDEFQSPISETILFCHKDIKSLKDGK